MTKNFSIKEAVSFSLSTAKKNAFEILKITLIAFSVIFLISLMFFLVTGRDLVHLPQFLLYSWRFNMPRIFSINVLSFSTFMLLYYYYFCWMRASCQLYEQGTLKWRSFFKAPLFVKYLGAMGWFMLKVGLLVFFSFIAVAVLSTIVFNPVKALEVTNLQQFMHLVKQPDFNAYLFGFIVMLVFLVLCTIYYMTMRNLFIGYSIADEKTDSVFVDEKYTHLLTKGVIAKLTLWYLMTIVVSLILLIFGIAFFFAPFFFLANAHVYKQLSVFADQELLPVEP